MINRQLLHNPIDHARQCLGFDGPTGFADGRQHGPSPVLRTVLMERTHQQTVRCADEIHVAGLPLAAAGYPLKAGQLTYDCRYSTMHGMPVTGGRGFRGLKPLWYNSVPP